MFYHNRNSSLGMKYFLRASYMCRIGSSPTHDEEVSPYDMAVTMAAKSPPDTFDYKSRHPMKIYILRESDDRNHVRGTGGEYPKRWQ
eukprot:1480517-Pyramimonas_sp.AAC.1